ncbi:Mu-like prophage major head subunit gpT family protein [Vibrio nomapromontoriensis]|uniref:Mu-like prophage major head subunit gpT family protein n=1 Tax=Vibrio nomapromontoriensis TaxID=2910246 RepID=UPI003D0C3AE3
MIATGANLTALYTAVKTNFNQGRSTYNALWPQLATLVPSTTMTENYAWIGEFTTLREWIGERQINRMKQYGYTLQNKKFEGTEAIPSEYVEDDNYGLLMPKFADMGYAAATHPDQKLFELIQTGFSEACYDGQYFFDTDHPVGREGETTSVSNFQTGAGSAWYLFDTSRPLKPFIFQRRKDYNLVSKTNHDTSDHVFMFDEYVYGVDARGNWGFGFWQQAFASKATLNDANFDSGFKSMMEFKSDQGRPLGIMPNLLVVGASNRAAAKKVIEAENKAQGETNTNYKAVQVLVVPWLP